jgi:lysozyme family protein
VKKLKNKSKFPQTFVSALEFVLKWEGGLSNDPDDPGGRTNKGITQRVYDSYRKGKGLPEQDVAKISEDEVLEIYYNNYWKAAKCDVLPERLQLPVFDTAVNMGVGTAIRLLQGALNEFIINREKKLKVDGIIGTKTLEAAQTLNPQAVAKKLLEFRLYRYCDIVKKNTRLVKFLKGWVRRVLSLWNKIT